MRTEILTEQARNFVVFRHAAGWVLTYLTGSVGLYEVSIRLTEDEVAAICLRPDFAKALAEQFRRAPQDYQARELRPSIFPPDS